MYLVNANMCSRVVVLLKPSSRHGVSNYIVAQLVRKLTAPLK